MKICTVCGEEKPLSKFYINYSNGKPRAKCKSCHNRQVIETRDPVKVREAGRRHDKKRQSTPKRLQQKREEYQRHQVKYRESQRRYSQTDVGRAVRRAAESRRRFNAGLQMDDLDREISTAYRIAIADDPCFYCDAKLAQTVDHYFPLSKGGTDHWFNLVSACRRCNYSKKARCGTYFVLRSIGPICLEKL